MPLRLIVGRANSGKTGILHESLASAAEDGRTALLLTPSFADVERYRTELARKGITGVHVDTLDQWATSLWSLFGDGRRIIGAGTRSAIAASVCGGAGDVLRPLAGTRGLTELLGQLVKRMAGEPRPSPTSPLDEELVALASDYFDCIRRHGLIEANEALSLLVDPVPVSGALLAFNRFTDFSPAQERLLRGAAEHNDVLVSLTYTQGHPGTEALEPLIGRLVEAGARLERVDHVSGDRELLSLEQQLFQPEEPIACTGSVVLAEAAGAEAEAAAVALLVRDLIAAGVDENDIAVTFRTVAQRAPLLAAALSTQGIDFEIDVSLRFDETALGQALLGLASLVMGTGSREALSAFLLGPFSDVDPAEVEKLDAAWRKRQTVAPATLLREARGLSSHTDRVVERISKAAKGLVDEAGARRWEEAVAELRATGRRRSESETRTDARVHRSVLTAAEEVASLEDSALSAADFLESLRASSLSTGGRERPGAVYITEAHRLRARRFSAVVLGGMNAGEFSSEKPEPLVARVLNRLGLPAGTEERLSERLLFYSVATRARDTLILVRQTSDSQGNALRASVFWEEITDLYRGVDAGGEVTHQGLEPSLTLPLSRLTEAAPAHTPGRRDVRQAVSDGVIPLPALTRGYLTEASGAAASDGVYSVTALERYHQCPYGWFYDRVVRPDEIDRTTDARARGNRVHEVMARFYRRFGGEIGNRVSPETLEEAHALLEQVIAQVGEETPVRPAGLADEISVASADEWARNAVTADATLLRDYHPAEQEWSFGDESLPFTYGGVRIRGRVDRVDVSDDGFVVIDYKSGKVQGHDRWMDHGLLQGAAYSAAVSGLMGLEPHGFLYRSMPTGVMRGFWNASAAQPEAWVMNKDTITADGLDALHVWAKAAIRAAVDGIEAGIITPSPRTKEACDWCGARGFCTGVVQ